MTGELEYPYDAGEIENQPPEWDFDNPELELSPPEIADAERAETHLRALAYWQSEQARIARHAQAQRDRINAWEEREQSKIDRRLSWHEQGLKAYLWNSGKKTVKLVYGTLKRVAGREKVEVLDTKAFLAWAKIQAPQCIRVKEEPDKTAIKEYIHTGGEIPPGTDLLPGEDSFSVVTEDSPCAS